MSDLDEKIAAINERRAKAREAADDAHKSQYATDLERLADLEDEHGVDRLVKIQIKGWKAGAGATTMVIAKHSRKSDSRFKRFVDMANRAKRGDKVDTKEIERASDMLALSCLLYPAPPAKGEKSDDGAYEATIELAPGLLTSVTTAIVNAAMGRTEEEGKG